MSSYTTTLNEVMKDLNNRQPKPIPEMIETARPKIFDFDYQTPPSVDKELFKQWFETTFLSRFAFTTMEQVFTHYAYVFNSIRTNDNITTSR